MCSVRYDAAKACCISDLGRHPGRLPCQILRGATHLKGVLHWTGKNILDKARGGVMSMVAAAAGEEHRRASGSIAHLSRARS